MRKRLLSVVLLVVLLTSLFTACSSQKSEDKSLEEMKAKGKMVLGLDDAFPPMGFKDDTGEIIGFDIDLAKEAAKRLGVELEIKPCVWDNIIMDLNNKNIDIIWNGMTVTDERKEKINFTSSYMKNHQIIIVTGDSAIATKADLEGKVVGLQMGSSSDKALKADKKTLDTLKEVKKFDDNVTALLDLKNGGIDAVVVDEIVGRYYLSKKPGEYKILEENFGEEEYAVGYRKEDESFGKELTRILDEMKKDGTASEISKKWFGSDIVEK